VSDSATFLPVEADDEDLGDLLLEVLPGDGSPLGNQPAREALSRAAERPISENDDEAVKERLLDLVLNRDCQGLGGSIRLTLPSHRGNLSGSGSQVQRSRLGISPG